MLPGLMSVTFRPYSIDRIVEIARDARLALIDWGGDVHVPPRNTDAARTARRLTIDAGLGVGSYASYYRLGVSEAEGMSFVSIIDAALELAATSIRVWAGRVGSDQATPDQRHSVVDDARRCCELARRAKITLTLEFHSGTLTDSADTTMKLLADIDSETIGTLWQPFTALGVDARRSGLQAVVPRLAGLHVFQWAQSPGLPVQRRSLLEGRSEWIDYLRLARTRGSMPAMLEFVHNDSPDQLIADARTLNEMIAELTDSPRT